MPVRIHKRGIRPTAFGETVAALVVIAVETWRLGPLEKAFPSKHRHAAESDGAGLLSRCYSAWTPLQPVFYGLGLLSVAKAFRIDFCVELICDILE